MEYAQKQQTFRLFVAWIVKPYIMLGVALVLVLLFQWYISVLS